MQKGAAVLAVAMLASMGWAGAGQAENACEIASKACEETRTGSYFQLVGMIPKPASVVKEWKATVDSGQITLDTPFGRSECSWEPASVDKIYAEGFNITIRVSAKALAENNSVSAGIQLVQGFGPNADLGPRNVIDVKAEPGQLAKDEATLHVSPHLPNEFLKDGDRINIDIGGCDAGAMTYVYEYRSE